MSLRIILQGRKDAAEPKAAPKPQGYLAEVAAKQRFKVANKVGRAHTEEKNNETKRTLSRAEIGRIDNPVEVYGSHEATEEREARLAARRSRNNGHRPDDGRR